MTGTPVPLEGHTCTLILLERVHFAKFDNSLEMKNNTVVQGYRFVEPVTFQKHLLRAHQPLNNPDKWRKMNFDAQLD